MQNVSPTFNLQAQQIYTEPAQLFIEAGPMGISFVIMNTGNFFQAVVIYAFTDKMDEAEIHEEIGKILENEPLLKRQYKKTHIFWAWPESILVPPEYMNTDINSEMLDLVYGDAGKNAVLKDFLYKHNLHNIYRVPENIQESFVNLLPYATQFHQYSLLVNREMKGGNEMVITFYTQNFTLMLYKENELQLIRYFNYGSPDDAAYHLLNVCKSFDVEPASVKLFVNGMIDKRSNLFNTIYKYFLNIEFENLPGNFTYTEDIKVHPQHFFSHLFFQASCV